ncbi:PASTA domain-containing protein [Gulosibacter macacae]|uniref:PASTA domain-containing protein n=1 Tax=Gulosibacter macacae TaxID=2488791 RepID=A0A3P3VUY8_9MICO|nr:transglycosylase domain-containing protein [Gulosibacter macacae]RRJ85788.1 PASTA domain-containing protein [Gulosibacter macacae]
MPSKTSTAPKGNVLAAVLGMLGMSGIAGVLVAAMITPLIAVAGVTANSTITLFESLPDYLDIQPLQQKTELYGMRGDQEEKFAEFYSQNRIEVPLDQISQHLIDGVIATEDPRYYEHGGVDMISAARAVLVSVLGDDGGGASTITMQYVRNQRVQAAEAILDPTERQAAYEQAVETTMGRKLQEMRLAIGVEKQYSKDQILEGYLNIALFGGTIYGVESAAQYYFGKTAKDLTLPEAALIAGMVQNPNQFRIDDPENIEEAQMRRDYVLRRMLEENKIYQAQYDEAVATPVTPNITPTKHGCMNATGNTGFFCDYVRKVILNDPAFGSTYEERLFNFQTKGYQIHTTIDLDLQQYSTDVMNNTVPHAVDYMDFGTAMSVVQPGTGHVLAMVQNKDFDETEAAAGSATATSVNYNTDYQFGGSSGFQVGSTYKIFTLANWIQSGHSLYESINAKRRSFNLAAFQDSCNGPYGGSWNPQNDGNANFNSMNAVEATSGSVNTAFVAMAEKLDQCVTRDIAMSMGAHRADGQPNSSYPSDVLGTNEIAPLSMATAIAAFANNGVSCSPIAISSITLRDGTDVTPPKSECHQAISPDVAAASNYALQAVMTGGTGVASNPYMGPMIGKSGTTDAAKDTWLIASTTGVALAIWVGNVTGDYSLYDVGFENAAGTRVRHVIANQVFSQAIPKYGANDFAEPNPDAFRVENVVVPDVTGMSVSAATSALEAAGFIVDVGGQVDSAQPSGTVAHTNPSANTSVPKGSNVTISTSNGKQPGASPSPSPSTQQGLPMPNIVGMNQDDALAALSAAGLSTINVSYSWRGPAGGTVESTDPPAGSNVAPNSTITVTAK